ncbi:DinB family protein [Streptomyces sp. NBC_00654]|uniref:DinB family protein n=1 Tax=Streptomyces sp. NBC_00654 TaxID=2975799 RepID=UPI0022584AD8|nr:DinB family protein [Streptomyces sp. NBC_00654]MCX4971287.1 DinB family protein [Streptomyces sp. NBC_00654]
MTPTLHSPSSVLSGERGELLRALAEQRELLLITVRGITDAQAIRRTVTSELTLGGIIKHLACGERVWTQILVRGDGELPDGMLNLGQYRMTEAETLSGLLELYEGAACETAKAVSGLPDLEGDVPLPRTPWSPPEPEYWSARRVLLHLIRETAQHAGHADIIREALDGANTTAQR